MSDRLPDDAIAALQAGRKIEAIKILREAEGIGLKEAKQRVDRYAGENPHILPEREAGSGGWFWVWLLGGAALAYYWLSR